jgi:hypothetical protein
MLDVSKTCVISQRIGENEIGKEEEEEEEKTHR